jgi:methyl-accepting chemotaxis protein
MLFWAMIRTAQVWLKTRAYLSLASHLASDAGAFEKRSQWSSQKSCPLAREFNDLLVQVPRSGSKDGDPLDKDFKRSGSATEIFTTANLGEGIVGSRLLMATPAILTGLGVLGTFVGLAMGIGGLDLSSQNINNLNQSIAPLIQGCSTAFITSVWGVFASILFTVLEKALEWLSVKRIQKVQVAFDALVPRYTPEESMLDLQRSSLEQEKISKGLAGAIGDAMQKAIDRLGNSITDAVKKTLGDGASDLAGKSAEMMAKALTDQLVKLEDSMKEISTQFHSEFGETNKNLTETISKFETVLSGVDETVKSSQAAVTQAVARLSAQEEVLKSLEDGARSLKEAAIELSSLRDTFTLSAEKNVLAATAQQDAATKNQLVANQFDSIGEKLPQVQESVSAAAQVIASLGQPILNLKDVLEKAQEQLGDQAKGQATRDEQFTGMLLEQTKNLVNAVSNAAEQFLEIKTLAASLGESSKSLENAGKWLSDLSENIKNSAEQYVAAAEASEKAAAAGERAATKLEPIPASVAALTDSLSEAGGKIKLGADSANGIYLQLITYQKQWFDGVKLGLTSMRDQLQTIIEQYGDSVSQETQKHMSDWTKAVNDSLGKFSSQVDALKEDINSLEETIEDLKTD